MERRRPSAAVLRGQLTLQFGAVATVSPGVSAAPGPLRARPPAPDPGGLALHVSGRVRAFLGGAEVALFTRASASEIVRAPLGNWDSSYQVAGALQARRELPYLVQEPSRWSALRSSSSAASLRSFSAASSAISVSALTQSYEIVGEEAEAASGGRPG